MTRARRRGAKAEAGERVDSSRAAGERAGAVRGGDVLAADRVPRWVVAAVLVIPFALVLLYGQLSDLLHRGSGDVPAVTAAGPTGQAQGSAQGQQQGQSDVTEMAARLAARLEREPNDPQGWSTLAHTYYVLGRFGDAVKAYERLSTIAQPDASTLADFADALAMSQGRSLQGRPMELVRKAIELDPAQWKAQSMAATDAFQRKDYASAISHWERALAGVPADSEIARALEGNIVEARQLSLGK